MNGSRSSEVDIMIFSENGHVKLEGNGIKLMAETVCILHSIYHTFSDKYGKEIANEKFVEIGRLAVMSEEEMREEMEKKIMDLAERME